MWAENNCGIQKREKVIMFISRKEAVLVLFIILEREREREKKERRGSKDKLFWEQDETWVECSVVVEFKLGGKKNKCLSRKYRSNHRVKSVDLLLRNIGS